MKKQNAILKKAESNSIKQIRIVRLLKTNYFRNCSIEFMNSKECVAFEVDMNRESFCVNLGQI
jgi:hypothetical protein